MKKILKTIAFVSTLFISGSLFASAYYTPYYNVYQNAPTSNSYIYTQGCYRYQYDRYTQITSLLGSNCTTANNYSYTYPTNNYSYTYPTTNYSYQYQTYTQPTSQYYNYSYHNGSWYPVNNWVSNGNGYNYYTSFNSGSNYSYWDNIGLGSYNGYDNSY